MANADFYSIVEYFNERDACHCGYCGDDNSSYSHGMWAHNLSVQDYQDLINRGWRRSGMFCYKPIMAMTCCPQYPIRCDIVNFALSQSQKKVIKRVNRYLITGQKSERRDMAAGDDHNLHEHGPRGDNVVCRKPTVLPLSSADIDTAGLDMCVVESDVGADRCRINESPGSVKSALLKQGEGFQEDSNSLDECLTGTTQGKSAIFTDYCPSTVIKPFRKAKLLRLERKMKKTGMTLEQIKAQGRRTKTAKKTLEELLNEPYTVESAVHHLELRLVPSQPASEKFMASLATSHSVYSRYQAAIHHDPPEKASKQQYTRFLVDSPLQKVEGALPHGYGSFHQQYWLDDKLIAVGVIDILTNCTSSVYVYYDPDYTFLSIGTYSALREIAFTRELHTMDPAVKFYYMGYYIHSCPKMKYKGRYSPSFLACPETYSWVPIERCLPLLDVKKYARFAQSDVVRSQDYEGKVDVDSVTVLCHRRIMPYRMYRAKYKGQANDEEEVINYAKLIGKSCSQQDYEGKVDVDSVTVLCHRCIMPYRMYRAKYKGQANDEEEVINYAKLIGKSCSQRMLLYRDP